MSSSALATDPAPRPARRHFTRPLRVGLFGFGTVGQAVARLICGGHPAASASLQLVTIFNRDVARKRVAWTPPDVVWTESADEALGADLDVVVELAGGLDPAGDWVRRALESGCSVVTANKMLISARGPALESLAASRGASLHYGAAVGGGIPMVQAIRDGLAGDEVTALAAILNGTTNYVLDGMEQRGQTLADALHEAARLGYAEADPTADIDGFDARAKLQILAREAFGWRIAASAVPCRPLGAIEPVDFTYARLLGCTIKQVAWMAVRAGQPATVEAGVGPLLVPRASPLSRTAGRENLLVTWGRFGGATSISGLGAGGEPTAVAVVSDLLRIADAGRHAVVSRPAPSDARVESDWTMARYVRFTVVDRPGILATLTAAFARHAVNVDAVRQEPGHTKSALPFVITLEPCAESALDAALADIGSADFLAAAPVALPIWG